MGDQDQALHLWKFTGGYEKIDHFNELVGNNPVCYLYDYLLRIFLKCIAKTCIVK